MYSKKRESNDVWHKAGTHYEWKPFSIQEKIEQRRIGILRVGFSSSPIMYIKFTCPSWKVGHNENSWRADTLFAVVDFGLVLDTFKFYVEGVVRK